MKPLRKLLVGVFLSSILLGSIFINESNAEELTYNRKTAKDYATRWCSETNSDLFKDYSSEGGDCANFASQNVMAGFGAFDKEGKKIVKNPFDCAEKAAITGTDGKTKGVISAAAFPSAIEKSFDKI